MSPRTPTGWRGVLRAGLGGNVHYDWTVPMVRLRLFPPPLERGLQQSVDRALPEEVGSWRHRSGDFRARRVFPCASPDRARGDSADANSRFQVAPGPVARAAD